MNVQAAYLFASSIGSLKFDVAVDETHTTSLAVSNYPVEQGAPIIDHTYPQPDQLVLNIAHGLTPLNAYREQGNSVRLVEFYDLLQAMQRSGELVEVVTGIKLYEDMVVTNVIAVRNRQNTSTVALTVTLLQVVRATLAQVEDFDRRYSDAVSVSQRAAPVENRGTIDPPEVADDSDDARRNVSLLRRGSDGLRNTLGLN